MAVLTLQVTIGAGVTRVSSVPIYCKWVSFQNNAAHAMHIGDGSISSSRGNQLLAGGGFFTPPLSIAGSATNLADWFVQGTQNDVLDINCDPLTF